MARALKRNPIAEQYAKYKKQIMWNKIQLWKAQMALHATPKYNDKVEEIFKLKGPMLEVYRTRHIERMSKKYPEQLGKLIPTNPKTLAANVADQTERRNVVNTLKKVTPFRPMLNPEFVQRQKKVEELKKQSTLMSYRQFAMSLRRR